MRGRFECLEKQANKISIHWIIYIQAIIDIGIIMCYIQGVPSNTGMGNNMCYHN